MSFRSTKYNGILVIGDPHLEGRVPGFRKDDYPQTILQKLRWCLNRAKKDKLLPVILGDLFQLPRDNPNWLLVELLEMFDCEIIGIYGNHDVHENQIDENDSLSVLAGAGRITLLDESQQFRGNFNGRDVLIGGTPWGQLLPDSVHKPAGLKTKMRSNQATLGFSNSDLESDDPLVIWLCHHDLIVPGYEQAGKIKISDRLGIDILINGHIHRRLEEVVAGKTKIITPGNISRRKRSDVTREHVPSVLKIVIDPAMSSTGWSMEYLTVPHRPYEEVFHEAIVEESHNRETQGQFVTGLAELQARATETGAGLTEFLEKNLHQFDVEIATEIRSLADDVLANI